MVLVIRARNGDYPILSVTLLVLMQTILPATAQGASACRKTHSESLATEAKMEILFQEDEATSRMRVPDYSRAEYPAEYYEKYRHRMANPYHETYAYNHTYLPQFINVPESRPRRLTGSFVSLDTFKPIPRNLDANLSELRDPYFYAAEVIWRGPKDDPIFPAELGQGTMARLFVSLYSTASSARQLIEGSLKRIYESFANQGLERQILVPIVKEQDQRDLERTTHFEYGIINLDASARKQSLQLDEVAHMQIITSTGPEQPFHFEEQWGRIDRVPGEVWGEAGRLILKHWELLNPESQSKVPREELKSIKYRLMHKTFAWSNNDARLDRLFFQVNDRVRGVLIEMGWPLEQAKATKKVQEINGETTQEWLYSLDKHLMIETEKRMLKNLMRVYFHKLAKNPSARWLEMSFDQNEIKTLIKLGVVQVSNDNPTPIFSGYKRRDNWPILHNTDPFAKPVFNIKPELLKKTEYLSLIFSSEMILKLVSEWAIVH